MNRKIILAFFGIDIDNLSFYDEKIDENDNSIHFFATHKKISSFCPHCGSTNILSKGLYSISLNASIIHNKKVVGHLKIRRFKCNDCFKTFKENYGIYERYSTISNIVKESIVKDLGKTLSYTFIAEEYNVSIQEVINIFDALPPIKRAFLPAVMCVDEFHFSKDCNKNPRFPFVISDPYSGQIVDIVEYRTKDVLCEYFQSISSFERKNVRFFISDMNTTFKEIKKLYFPNSIHIVDHFHVIKSFNDAIHNIRRKYLKDYKFDKSNPRYKSLKNNRKLFLMPQNKLIHICKNEEGYTTDLYFQICDTFRFFPELGEIYYAREEFCREMTKMKDYEETSKFFDFYCLKLTASISKSLQNLAKTLKHWRQEIINAYAKNETGFYLTNATAEANNNKIQTYINCSYGLTNFNRLRKRILYINESNTKRGF